MQHSNRATFASCYPEVDCLFTNYMHKHRRTLLTGDAEGYAGECSSCQSEGASRAPLAEALADYYAARQDGDADAASSAASSFVVALTEHLRQTTNQSPESADPSEAVLPEEPLPWPLQIAPQEATRRKNAFIGIYEAPDRSC